MLLGCKIKDSVPGLSFFSLSLFMLLKVFSKSKFQIPLRNDSKSVNVVGEGETSPF